MLTDHSQYRKHAVVSVKCVEGVTPKARGGELHTHTPLGTFRNLQPRFKQIPKNYSPIGPAEHVSTVHSNMCRETKHLHWPITEVSHFLQCCSIKLGPQLGHSWHVNNSSHCYSTMYTWLMPPYYAIKILQSNFCKNTKTQKSLWTKLQTKRICNYFLILKATVDRDLNLVLKDNWLFLKLWNSAISTSTSSTSLLKKQVTSTCCFHWR